MASIHDTCYPRLKPNPSDLELKNNFLPTQSDIALLDKNTSHHTLHTRLGFMLMLKSYQCLGYFTPINNIPKSIIKYISHSLNIRESKVDLKKYQALKQRQRHKDIIRKYLNRSVCKIKRKQVMKSTSLKSAESKEKLSDIINDMLEELVKNYYEIPAFSTLLRLARASRAFVTSALYDSVANMMTDQSKLFFDELLASDKPMNAYTSGWHYLKQEIKKPTASNVRDYVHYIEQLKEWFKHCPLNFSHLSEHRLDQYVSEAIALDISDMRRIKDNKRYALSAMFLYRQYAQSLDNTFAVLMKWFRKMKNDASDALSDIRNKNRHTTDELISKLRSVLIASQQDAASPTEKLQLIENSLPSDIDASLEACDQHLLYANDNDLTLMQKYYMVKRSTMLRLLNLIQIKSSSNNKLVEILIDFIYKNKRLRSVFIDIQISNYDNLHWTDDQWFSFITHGKNRDKNNTIISIDHKRFELAIFKYILSEVNCGDAFIVDSYQNDDPNKQLISWDQFHDEIENYTSLIGKSKDANEFIAALMKEHAKSAKMANKKFKKNEYLNIINGQPILKKAKKPSLNKRLMTLSEMVHKKIPLTDIIIVLTDLEKWLHLSKHLKPLSGYEAKIDDYDLRFIATCFAYGCNIGPVQAERCLRIFSRKQIAWLFNHHITEYRLNKISECIIQAYKKFELPFIWGEGKSASVDGTYWDMYTNNLLSEHHIRYGSYGGIGYYHVSDQYIALFGNFIPCGVYEAIYLFDAIYNLDKSLRPDTIHGDTHAQNEVVFGLSYLLSISLMPRIRSFKKLKFYKPYHDKGKKPYNHISDIFCDNEINWDLIESMYHDMLRVVMSIKSGKIKASTILKKLCSKSKKNKLHQAFRELGRVVRTMFLLDYISDVDLRKKIQAATCKSEEFNDFISWISFGKEGIIHDNNRANQQKIIAFGRMVANATMFHTVANTTHALNELAEEGIEYTKDDLSILSPYYRENINRYGAFDLSRSKAEKPLAFNISGV